MLVCSALTHCASRGKNFNESGLLCGEQKEYAIELTKIHESFVDELARGKLLIRQSFFLVITGLMLYYFVKKDGSNKPLLRKDLLFIFLILSTLICHCNEGILNYWQAEHLNKIWTLEGSLDRTEFDGWFANSHVYRPKYLPWSEEKNFGVQKAFGSWLLFTYSLSLNASSIGFYYLILFCAVIIVLMWEDIHYGMGTAPLPVDDMPEDVKKDFTEARNIVDLSPRSASALLRLALRKLINELGAKEGNLDEKIEDFVSKKLSVNIQQALDSVRVIGNDAIHPGQIDSRDDADTAACLFELTNAIVEVMIAKPKKIQEICNKLLSSKKEPTRRRGS